MASADPFDTTVHKTHAWLADIMQRLGWDDRHRAWNALRAVLHAMRDRLSVEEAAAFGAQLPLLVRGAYYEGWRPSGKPERFRHEAELVAKVEGEMRGYREVIDAAEVTRAVLASLPNHVSPGEVAHLARLLPREIGALLQSAASPS